MKLVTDTHFAFVRQTGGTMPLVSTADSLAAYRTRGFGGGTYTVTDSTYTEQIEYFSDPEYVGREITFSCRIDSGRWHHSYDWTVVSGGQEGEVVHIDEVWRKVE